jgi:hypothetical protein
MKATGSSQEVASHTPFRAEGSRGGVLNKTSRNPLVCVGDRICPYLSSGVILCVISGTPCPPGGYF